MSGIDFDDDTDTVWDSYLLDRLLDPDGANDGSTSAPSAAALFLLDEDGEPALAGAISIRDADTYDDATELFETDVQALFALLEERATGALVSVGGEDYRLATRETAEDGAGGAVRLAHLQGDACGIVLALAPDAIVAGYWDEDRKNTRAAATEAATACVRALHEDMAL